MIEPAFFNLDRMIDERVHKLFFRGAVNGGGASRRKDISLFEPEEIDDLDESLLETMDREELADFRDDLQDTLDQMMTWEPDPDTEEDAYYEWQNRINVLNDMIDAIDSQME